MDTEPAACCDPNGDDAVVFLDWTWSRQAGAGRRLFEEWVARRRPRVRTLVVLPDEDQRAQDWLLRESHRTGKGFHGGGHGSLLFVHREQVVGWIPEVHRSDIAEINRTYEDTRIVD